MIILIIRSENPEAEIGLYHDGKELVYLKWRAHRMLAETINKKIDELLARESKTLKNIEGIVAYKGPGSFTGLRIGLSVANALAYGLKVPIVGATGEFWIQEGAGYLLSKKNEKMVMPEYGADVHIIPPRK
ncbi:tRNA (adenosine(37)-N6)-threonylcarbamoyltransferase complex dimerization subunit type 1 TsaB [Candidatus Saccharibacteria bacterium]|nr:tRNA (adenosine(37)-N6)-threonylcarbamoyltransferase complex dimerization subunit type 1 TsaB [Candidatus Saccharibacteria bacterium]